MQVRSVHNTPIEGFWRWLRQSDGLSLKEEILAGKDHFNLLNPYHKPLFFWIWVPLIQSILDKQREYWNSRAPRSQSNKIAPTGPSPNMLIELPHLYDADAVDCSIKVQPEWVQQERERLGGMTERDRLFKWVPDVFEATANNAWKAIGSPTIDQKNAWGVFEAISKILGGEIEP
ncbi:hypothetical protein FRB91_005965 [Serendipita sp. 411]|nr:hypothetical protein FRC18_000567 [Serendipita sp. 400]KAG8840527.1 hypothetical protein FRB91_005965 [Serendipita sp. 411]